MATEYKYGNGVSGRARWAMPDNRPYMTDHALERWDERTPATSVSPEHAWEHGVDVTPIAEFVRPPGSPVIADRVRYYYDPRPSDEGGRYGALLVVADDVIKTVYEPSMINHGPSRAYLGAYNTSFIDDDIGDSDDDHGTQGEYND